MKFGLDIPRNAAYSFNLLLVLLISTIYSKSRNNFEVLPRFLIARICY